MFPQILFYLFSFIIISSAFVAISSKSTMNSVLLLVLIFFNTAGIFILLGAEFVAIILILVYVGAIAVLFLFVVMMLDVENKKSLIKISKKQYCIYSFISLIIFAEIISLAYISLSDNQQLEYILYSSIIKDENNTLEIGKILYTDYIFIFQSLGIILFIAMVGSIALTLNKKRAFIKQQNVAKQIARNKENSISMI
jgi:NADH-quinone oxidoreductase subunit J